MSLRKIYVSDYYADILLTQLEYIDNMFRHLLHVSFMYADSY